MFDDAYNSDRDQQFTTLLNSGQFGLALELLQEWYEAEPWNGEVLMRMAVVHWLSGEPARTLRDLDAYLELDPENAEALARRAQALLMLGKRADAEASLAKAEAIDAHTPGVLLNRALLREEHGELAQAISDLTAYLEQIPTDHLALARRSHLHRQLGAFPEALADALACVEMHPEDPEAHFAEALAHVTLERGAEALAACDRCLQQQAHFLPALRLKVDLLSDLGRIEEAEEHLAQLLASDPDSPNSALLRARVAAEQADFPTALTWMNRFLDDAPDEAHGYYRRGMIFYRMGDFQSALHDFREYIRLLPTAIEGYEQQFMCLLELEQLPEAIEVGRIAVKLQPQNYRVQYNLAFAELLSGNTARASEGFRLSIELDPQNEELLLRIYLAFVEHAGIAERVTFLQDSVQHCADPTLLLRGLLAETSLENGQLEEALQLTNNILATDDSRPFGYLLGIKSLCLLNRYADAMAIADRGIARLPYDGRLRLARALVLRDTEQPEEALQELTLAEQLLPGDPEVLRQRALVYGSIGQVDDAVELLQQAVGLDQISEESYFWLSYFQLHRQQYQPALDAANQLLVLVPNSAEGHLMRGAALRGLRHDREAEHELVLVREQDPGLIERLRIDPVMAELLVPAETSGLANQVRKALVRRWHGVRRVLGKES